MLIVKSVTVDGLECPVTISDEREALLAAEAAGGAIIGIWSPNQENDLPSCLYLVTEPEDVTPQLLERAARRRLDLPWRIAGTERLWIREFGPEDPLEEISEEDGDGVFSNWERREAYRRNQYRFCECGLWALVRKEDGLLVGKAGITDGQLGYHIYAPFRRQGYGLEACREILHYAGDELGLKEVTLSIRRGNTTSERLASRLGFEALPCSGTDEKIRKKNLTESYCILYAKRL